VQTFGQIMLVAIGSALGGLARFGVAVWFDRRLGTAFPWATLFINLTGSLFLGWFMTVLQQRLVFTDESWVRPNDLRLLIAFGFTGAYTTFSTFEMETLILLNKGNWLAGAAYVALSVFLGLLAVRLGVFLGLLGKAA
jgi:CrcB protein